MVAPYLQSDLSWRGLVETPAFTEMVQTVDREATALYFALSRTEDHSAPGLGRFLRERGLLLQLLPRAQRLATATAVHEKWTGDDSREYAVVLLKLSRLSEAATYLEKLARKRGHTYYLTRQAVQLVLSQVYLEQGRHADAERVAAPQP